jgi:glycerophosphoryl diester phosphodiesterase
LGDQKAMTKRVQVWGHRGYGCTDSDFARQRAEQDGVPRPAENTLKSLIGVLTSGHASGIETDLIATADNHLVLTHSTDYLQHLCGRPQPAHLPPTIDEMTLEQVKQLRVGPNGIGQIPTLRELFESLSRLVLPDDFCLNLELKGVQGTQRTPRQPSIAQLALDEIAASGFELQLIRFSSFSLTMLQQMQDLEPRAALALLTDVGPEHGGDAGKPIFPALPNGDCYQHFTPQVIAQAMSTLPSLMAVHPEIRTFTRAAVTTCATHKLQLASWAWQELSPKIPPFSHYRDAAEKIASDNNVNLCHITDYSHL